MNKPLKAILVGGLAAGLVDLAFALIYFGSKGANPQRLLQTIARGAIGPDSLQGGWATASLGLFLHFCVATAFAAAFVLATRRFAWPLRHAWLAGLGYGAIVYFAMSWVVIPLSAFGNVRFPPVTDWVSLAGHILLVGPAIVLPAKRFASR